MFTNDGCRNTLTVGMVAVLIAVSTPILMFVIYELVVGEESLLDPGYTVTVESGSGTDTFHGIQGVNLSRGYVIIRWVDGFGRPTIVRDVESIDIRVEEQDADGSTSSDRRPPSRRRDHRAMSEVDPSPEKNHDQE
jgi:hypothetical protein